MIGMVMIKCERCLQSYDHTKSSSSLKLTYCGMSCEIGGLGFSLEALEKGIFIRRFRVQDVLSITDEDIILLKESAGPSVEINGRLDDDRPLVHA